MILTANGAGVGRVVSKSLPWSQGKLQLVGGLLKLGVGGVGDDNGCENLGDLLLVVIEDEMRVADLCSNIHLFQEPNNLGDCSIIREETSSKGGEPRSFGSREIRVVVLVNVEEKGSVTLEIFVLNGEWGERLKELGISFRGELADDFEMLHGGDILGLADDIGSRSLQGTRGKAIGTRGVGYLSNALRSIVENTLADVVSVLTKICGDENNPG